MCRFGARFYFLLHSVVFSNKDIKSPLLPYCCLPGLGILAGCSVCKTVHWHSLPEDKVILLISHFISPLSIATNKNGLNLLCWQQTTSAYILGI